MLTPRLQIQLIADRLAGIPTRASSKDFAPPWLQCWEGVERAAPGQEQDALYQALTGLPNRLEVLQAILAARPGFRPNILSLAEMAPGLPPIEFVWPGRIPRGMITVLGASQGSGKSFMMLDLLWRIVHNKGFPDGAPIPNPGANIIYVDAEMVPQILNQRAEHYGLDRNKLFVMLPDPGEMIDLSQVRYQERLTDMAALLKPELIIIDSLSSVHSGGQNNVEDVRSLMGFLIQLATWADCGLVLVHHIRKPPGGQQRMMNFDLGMEDLSGSGYITQQARVVLGLRVVQTGPEFDPNGPRELKVLKTNLGPYESSLGFQFAPLHPTGVMLKWDATPPKPYREPTQLDECKEWLEDFLKGSEEGEKVKEVIAAAKEQGISPTMVYRARNELAAHILNTCGHKSPLNRWKWSDEAIPNPDPKDD